MYIYIYIWCASMITGLSSWELMLSVLAFQTYSLDPQKYWQDVFFRCLALNHACRWHGWFCVLLCIFARREQCGRHPCRCVPWFFKCLWISWTAGLKWTKLHSKNCKKFCLKSTLSSSQVICDKSQVISQVIMQSFRVVFLNPGGFQRCWGPSWSLNKH